MTFDIKEKRKQTEMYRKVIFKNELDLRYHSATDIFDIKLQQQSKFSLACMMFKSRDRPFLCFTSLFHNPGNIIGHEEQRAKVISPFRKGTMYD